jgi:dTMP kinase
VSRGAFIAVEGGEASGKSTQARLLAERIDAVLTREPGGTALGERLRELLLDPATGPVDARTELLLMAAARAEHVAQVIRPALDAGRTVVSDRFSASSLAYQGYGRGLSLDEVRRVSEWATGGVEPDLVVLIDVDPSVAAARLAASGAAPDRLEAAGSAFHAAVADGFRALAAADPGRWVVVDGDAPVARLAQTIAERVGGRLEVRRSAQR